MASLSSGSLILLIPPYHDLPHGCWCGARVAWRVPDGDGLTDGPGAGGLTILPLVFCNVHKHLMQTRRNGHAMTRQSAPPRRRRGYHGRQCNSPRNRPKSCSRQNQVLDASWEEKPQPKRVVCVVTSQSPALQVSLMNAVALHHFSQK